MCVRVNRIYVGVLCIALIFVICAVAIAVGCSWSRKIAYFFCPWFKYLRITNSLVWARHIFLFYFTYILFFFIFWLLEHFFLSLFCYSDVCCYFFTVVVFGMCAKKMFLAHAPKSRYIMNAHINTIKQCWMLLHISHFTYIHVDGNTPIMSQSNSHGER